MRKFTARIIAFIAIAACVWAVAYYGFLRQDKQQYNFKTAKIEKKDIIQSIDATGTVEPEELVDVGARVSGEIVAFGKDKNGKEVDYGSEITEGSLIALIDDEIPRSDILQAKARLEQAKASLAQAKATLLQNEANLRKAERDWSRAQRLGVSEALSQASYDAYLADWETATAQIEVSKAQILQANAEVAQAEAALKVEERNLEYCQII